MADQGSAGEGSAAGNRLLDQIAMLGGPSVLTRAERIHVKAGQVLHEPDDVMPHVYFPVDCLVSLLHVMESGDFSEAALVGNDGVVGVALVMGGDSMPLRAQAHVGGTLYRLRSDALRQLLADIPALQQVLLRYAQTLLTQMGQVAACNRHHALGQQFSRRLLMSLDRLPRPELRMTQESVAQMLGVRRESVTLAANKLHKAGMIRYSRGLIQVLDRAALEAHACECYDVIGRELRRLNRQPAGNAQVGAFAGSGAGARVVPIRTAAVPEAAVSADAASSDRDRRSGSDRRHLAADRRCQGIAISFPDRRLAPDRRLPDQDAG